MTIPNPTTSIVCSRCGDTKPPDEFNMDKRKRNGYQSHCRSCGRSAARAQYRANPARSATLGRRWRHANPEKVRAIKRRARQRHRPARLAAAKERATKYPERIAAVAAVRDAIRAGDLIRGPCFACESTKNVQGHHEDYSKPYEVMWFCCSCHQTYHTFIERLKNGGTK